MDMCLYCEKPSVILIIFIILAGCVEKEPDIVRFEAFPEEMRLTGKSFDIPITLYSPWSVIILEDHFVVTEHESDHLFHLFSVSELSYLGSFIGHGRGPDEEQGFVNQNMRRINNHTIIYQTINEIKSVTLDRDKNDLSVTETFHLVNNIYNFQHVFKLGDRFYGYEGMLGLSTEFHGYNPDTDEIFEFGKGFPDLGQKLHDGAFRFLENKRVTVKPDETLFAAAYLYFPIVRIFQSADGMVTHDTRYENGQHFPFVRITENPSEEQKESVFINYSIINSTNKYVYALYVGKTVAQDKSSENRSDEIHVFDWEGRPVKKLILGKEIFGFDVCPDDNYLIASSMNHPYKLFKFVLTGE